MSEPVVERIRMPDLGRFERSDRVDVHGALEELSSNSKYQFSSLPFHPVDPLDSPWRPFRPSPHPSRSSS